MEKQEVRTNWLASIALENLTQEQVNSLIDTMIEKIESMGGFMGGGFIPADDPLIEDSEDDQD